MPTEVIRGIGPQGRLLLVAVAFVMSAVVVHMLRRRRLHEEYALVWLGMLAVMLLVVASRGTLFLVTRLVGAKYPASALTLISLAVIFLFLILYSTRISVLSDKVVRLTQELAILRSEREQGHSPGPSGGPSASPRA